MCTLSREWRRLGICHQDMVFTKDTFFDPNNAAYQAHTAAEEVFIRRLMTPKFIANVDNVLRQLWSTPTTTSATTLDRFAVKFGLCRCHAHHVDGWMHFATASRAKHIDLDFSVRGDISESTNQYIFPLCELGGLNGSSVESLHLTNVCLEVPAAPGFDGIANLRELRLRAMSINIEVLQFLLLGSALLECLTIKNCLFSSPCTLRTAITNLKELSLSSVYFINWDGLLCLLLGCALLESLSIENNTGLHGLSIRQELRRLKYLKVCMCNLKSLELHAPNLTTFVFDDPLTQIVFTGSPKVLEATFALRKKLTGLDEYINIPLHYTLAELPTIVPHVHKLLLHMTVEAKERRFTKSHTGFINLRHLNLNLFICGDENDTSCLVGLVNLLELAPMLEELELHMDCFIRNSGPNLHTVTATPGHPHHHLRSVYMTGFDIVVGLAEFALYILENATILERMVVDPVVRIKLNAIHHFYSTMEGGSSSGQEKYTPTDYCTQERNDKIRMFAKEHLDIEEFREMLTIL